MRFSAGQQQLQHFFPRVLRSLVGSLLLQQLLPARVHAADHALVRCGLQNRPYELQGRAYKTSSFALATTCGTEPHITIAIKRLV
jgi:hypothetical protein